MVMFSKKHTTRRVLPTELASMPLSGESPKESTAPEARWQRQ